MLQVKLINTLTHLASVVEVFAADDGGGLAAVPAATAHTVNLAQLPTASMLGGCEVGTLRPEAAQRALALRSAEQCEDWALIIGGACPLGPPPVCMSCHARMECMHRVACHVHQSAPALLCRICCVRCADVPGCSVAERP